MQSFHKNRVQVENPDKTASFFLFTGSESSKARRVTDGVHGKKWELRMLIRGERRCQDASVDYGMDDGGLVYENDNA